jgi:hypothetical protein
VKIFRLKSLFLVSDVREKKVLCTKSDRKKSSSEIFQPGKTRGRKFCSAIVEKSSNRKISPLRNAFVEDEKE